MRDTFAEFEDRREVPRPYLRNERDGEIASFRRRGRAFASLEDAASKHHSRSYYWQRRTRQIPPSGMSVSAYERMGRVGGRAGKEEGGGGGGATTSTWRRHSVGTTDLKERLLQRDRLLVHDLHVIIFGERVLDLTQFPGISVRVDPYIHWLIGLQTGTWRYPG